MTRIKEDCTDCIPLIRAIPIVRGSDNPRCDSSPMAPNTWCNRHIFLTLPKGTQKKRLIRLMSTWRNVLQDRVYKVFVCALSFNKAQDNLLSVKDSPEANSSCPWLTSPAILIIGCMSSMPARTPLIDILSHYRKECRDSLFGRTFFISIQRYHFFLDKRNQIL